MSRRKPIQTLIDSVRQTEHPRKEPVLILDKSNFKIIRDGAACEIVAHTGTKLLCMVECSRYADYVRNERRAFRTMVGTLATRLLYELTEDATHHIDMYVDARLWVVKFTKIYSH